VIILHGSNKFTSFFYEIAKIHGYRYLWIDVTIPRWVQFS